MQKLAPTLPILARAHTSYSPISFLPSLMFTIPTSEMLLGNTASVTVLISTSWILGWYKLVMVPVGLTFMTLNIQSLMSLELIQPIILCLEVWLKSPMLSWMLSSMTPRTQSSESLTTTLPSTAHPIPLLISQTFKMFS